MAHVHTYTDASGAQRAHVRPEDCDYPQYHQPARTTHGLATTHTFDPTTGCLGDNCSCAELAKGPAEDLRLRWRPTLAAHAAALNALRQDGIPAGTIAAIVLVQPGKDRGVWLTGQPVETVPGVVLLATAGGHDDHPVNGRVLDYAAARTLAENIGRAYLAGRDGTSATAWVDGTHCGVTVFESYR